MKIFLTNRGASALLFLAAIYFCIFSSPVFAGGAKDRQEETANLPARILVSTEPSEKPSWVDVVPQNETDLFFVGTSNFFDTPANARDKAREDARNQVLVYYGQVIERQAVSSSTITGSTRDTLAAYVVNEDQIRTFAQNVVSEVATLAYYTETYLNNEKKEAYIVYTLHRINRQKAEEEISGLAKNISERYTASFSQWRTLRAALEGCAFIARSLEQNPLHRIMAYYETSTGRAGLYEYVRLQINELANSVSIEAIPSQAIQETESLSVRINIRSSIMSATGLLDCQASLFGISGSGNITYPYKSASDDPFNLQIRNINPGSYNVMVEILLSDLTGGIAKNTGVNFSLTVTPQITSKNVVLNFSGDTPTARDKQTITSGLRNALQTWNIDLYLDENSSEGTGYSFNITVYRNRAAANPGLLQAEASVVFSRNGRVLCQNVTYYITETSEALIARRITERLQGDREFFNRVNEVIR